MEYKVQRGDTIAHVSKVMGSDWQTLKKLNPQAVGRSKANGNWFVREGAVLSDQTKADFGVNPQVGRKSCDPQKQRNREQSGTGNHQPLRKCGPTP